MPYQLFGKLVEIVYQEIQDDIQSHEIEERLQNHLLGKELEFETVQGGEGLVRFQNIGRGKKAPSTAICLELEGIKFERTGRNLCLDLRYIFHELIGREFLRHNVKFLIKSPTVVDLAPNRFMINFAIYGDTVFQVNRSLQFFSEIVRFHQGELHQEATKRYEEGDYSFNEDVSVTLPLPDPKEVKGDSSIHVLSQHHSDESYIERYIAYLEDHDDWRSTIDNRNTFAQEELN